MSVNAVDQTTGNTTPLAGNTNNLVGNLSALTTNTKSDAVGAINEVNQTKQNATDNNLQTTDKTIVGGINELRSGLIDVNSNIITIANAIKNVDIMSFTDRSSITINLKSAVGGQIFAFNANQAIVFMIRLDTIDTVAHVIYDKNGGHTITATKSDGVLTITPSNALWGVTTMIYNWI